MTDEIGGTTEESRSRKRLNVQTTCQDGSGSERSGSELGESSGDEWVESKKKEKAVRLEIQRPKLTLKSKLAERTKILKKDFRNASKKNDKIVEPVEDRTNRDIEDVIKDVEQRPEEQVVEKSSQQVNEKNSTKVGSDDVVNEEKRDEDIKPKILNDNQVICVKTEKTDKINEEEEKPHDAVTDIKVDKNVKCDIDTVIILSDDEDDVQTVVLNFTTDKTKASPYLCESVAAEAENPAPFLASPTLPSSFSSQSGTLTNGPTTVADNPSTPRIRINPLYQSTPGTPPTFTSPVNNLINASSSVRTPSTRGRNAYNRTPVSSRGRRNNYKPQKVTPSRTPLVSPQTPRVTSAASTKSNTQSPVTLSSSRLNMKNISTSGTTIRKGSNSITITPTKKTPERPPVQRKLFRNEVEGKIGGRVENGVFQYVLNLANGTHLKLSEVQVEKLREQNRGTLPTTLRIPVPSDVAATIEPIFLIED